MEIRLPLSSLLLIYLFEAEWTYWQTNFNSIMCMKRTNKILIVKKTVMNLILLETLKQWQYYWTINHLIVSGYLLGKIDSNRNFSRSYVSIFIQTVCHSFSACAVICLFLSSCQQMKSRARSIDGLIPGDWIAGWMNLALSGYYPEGPIV